jgi:hypothetical protein
VQPISTSEETMPSKELVERQEMLRRVEAAVDTEAGAVAHAVSTNLGAHLAAGEQLPDLALLLRLGVRALEQELKAIEAADASLEKEKAAVPVAAPTPVSLAQEIQRRLADLKLALSRFYGRVAPATVGLTAAPPAEPEKLAQFLEDRLAALAKAKFPNIAGADLSESVKQLESDLQALRAQIAPKPAAAPPPAATPSAKVAYEAAISAFDARMGFVETLLEGLQKVSAHK